jgi:hypothetical protein
MAIYNKLVGIINAIATDIDLTTHSIQMTSILIGSTSPVEITKAIATKLVNLQNGSDVDSSVYHSHDGRYYTETELNTRVTTPGSTLIGVEYKAYSNITGYTSTITNNLANYNVQALLDAVNSSLGSISSDFLDTAFRISDDGDTTKKIAFQASGITTGTVRTITMADADVNLTDVNNAILRDGSRAFTANQPMGSFKLTGLAAGTSAGDSVRYEQAVLITGVNAFTANQSFGSFKATNLADPTVAQDAATKAYVDAALDGRAWKQSVKAATTAALANTPTYDNGTAGVGATLTAGSNGALPAQDGITLAVNDKLLVKNQASALQNGIYVVTDVGDGSNPYILTRSIDNDTTLEMKAASVFVEEGTTQADYQYTQSADSVTMGTTGITWVLTSANSFSGHDMISLSGGQISVDLASASGLVSTNPGNAAGQLTINLESSNPTLIIGSNQLGVKFSATTSALQTSASGLMVKVEGTNPTLLINGSNELAVKLNTGATTGNITTSATGLKADTDGTTLETASNALQVKDLGISTAKLAATSVTKAKLNSDVVSYGLTQEADGSLAVRKVFVPLTNGSGGSISAANLVRLTSTAGEFAAADATALSTSKGTIGVLLATTSDTATGQVQVSGRCTVVVESGSLTPGERCYLSSTSAGRVTMTAPSAAGNVVYLIGIACSTTEVILQPTFLYQVG